MLSPTILISKDTPSEALLTALETCIELALSGVPTFSDKKPFSPQAYLASLSLELPLESIEYGAEMLKEDRCRFFEKDYYKSFVGIYGPNPFDCLRLRRTTRQWVRLVKKHVNALKELSNLELIWLQEILDPYHHGVGARYKIPNSFFSRPQFLKPVKHCLDYRCPTSGSRETQREKYINGIMFLSTLTAKEASFLLERIGYVETTAPMESTVPIKQKSKHSKALGGCNPLPTKHL